MNPLLLLRDRALHAGGRLRIFAADLGERGAGRFLLLQRRKRLAETQQRIRRLAGMLVLGRYGEEGLGRVAIVLLLIERLAHPVLRVRDQLVLGIFADEVAEGLRREAVILVQHIAIGEVVFVLWLGRRRQGREPRAGRARIALRRRRQLAACGRRALRRRARGVRRGGRGAGRR